jgi:hypothetical protein
MMSLEVALEALRTDAQAWDAAAEVLDTASSTATDLYLSTMTFPQVISDVPLQSTYEELRSLTYTLLTGGKKETEAIADTLLEIKAAYESTDSSAAAQYDGLWEYIP